MLWFSTSGPASSTTFRAASLALKIGYQHFDPAAGHPRPRFADGCREVSGAEVGQIVAVDRCHDDVGQLQGVNGARDFHRFGHVRRRRRAVGDIAVPARSRACVAEDHESRSPVVPALADIRTVRFLTDRMQA